MQIKNVLSGAMSVIIDATKSTGVKVSAAATVPTALILDHLGKLPQAAAEMFYRNGDGQTIHSLNGTCTVIEDSWFGHIEHPMWDPFNTCSWLYPDKPWLNVTSSIGQPIADALYGKLPDSIASMQNGTAGMFYTTKGGIIHSVNGTCTVIQDTLFGRVSHPMFDPLNTCSTLYPDKPYLHVTDAIKQPVADAFFGLTPERAAQLQKEAAEKSGSHVADAFNQTTAQITNSTAEHAPATVKKNSHGRIRCS